MSPAATRTSSTPSALGTIDPTLVIGVTAAVLFFLAAGIIAFWNTHTLRENSKLVAHTHEVLSALGEVLSFVKDAETGQRGFVLTGEEGYLEPYSAALRQIDARIADIERLTLDNPDQQRDIPVLRECIAAKIEELEKTVALRRDDGFEAALAVVKSDQGKQAMDELREQVGSMQERERSLRAARLAETDDAFRIAVGSGLLTSVLGVALCGIVAFLLHRAAVGRQHQAWLQAGQLGLSREMLGDQRIEQLGDNILRFLAEYLDAHAGAFFASDDGGFRRVASYGVPSDGRVRERFEPGDGLLGQTAKNGRTFLVREAPDGYLTIGSALGQSNPRHLIIAPGAADGVVNAVFELGFIHPLGDRVTELLDNLSETIGVAVRSAKYRAHLQDLLEETQRQAEELQAQSEELRVSNEELEEQSRALKESQSRLENQQTELEQNNVQLEEQANLLAGERDSLIRAQGALQTKSRELEQASRYKSDFLANMSHELRTPLNSSLILAKLLADNPQGNLSDEQVRYAETIRGAGNDLLSLINDILDLSKIEAGHMEVRPEPVPLSELSASLARTFEPVAAEKGLRFSARSQPGCPTTIETDRQRLEQVLKNLLSNAIKFTEKGEVDLTISRAADGRATFVVTDTGIGIPAEHHELVFEAFRQADGTTNRKFGGTGLGLSISRELVRLLGGELSLASEPGRGSAFTVTIPLAYDATLVLPRTARETTIRETARPPIAPSASPRLEKPSSGAKRIEDDRERLTGARRTILVVEDDPAFARILSDLVHELDFQCLIASTAEEGIALAAQYVPSAVVLDIGLPDHSGLSVLDRLKHDARTRHVPVHVVSAGEHAEAALSLGAVGYILKPVKREELVEALKGLETRFAQRMRRVLVVEDDPVQLDSLRKLLGSHAVETVGAENAAACLARLRESTFDCMVLDLSLPDASGYSLLETLSGEDAYSFPPVIVYTGRELSDDQERQLRRYSKSIIIKGAKSPERLLDEVTLFLHQVEADLPAEQQRMLARARSRDAALEGRRILVVEDDVRNVFALVSILEPRGAATVIARNGREALEALDASAADPAQKIDLVLMDVMMPEMDGLEATREIRSRTEWKKLPIVMLTAKAMRDDQEKCLAAGASDYLAKPLDMEKLLSLVRVWMPR